MPASAQRLVKIIGFLPALEVLRVFGGDRVYIPRNVPDAGHMLATAIGADVLRKLVAGMGGMRLELPLLTSVERCLRDRALLADRDAGATTRDLHLRYGITPRSVRKIIGRRATAVTVGR